MNKVILSGNIVKDIEARHINDKKVLNNTIAVRRYKDTTDFINFVVWEKNAKFLEDYAKKYPLIVQRLTGFRSIKRKTIRLRRT